MFKTIIFDLDSTLVTIEGLDWLSSRVGKQKESAELTQKSMNGEVKFSQALKIKMGFISPSPADFMALGKQYQRSITPGAISVIHTLQQLDKKVWILTSNFLPAVRPLAQSLRIPLTQVIANPFPFNSQHPLSQDYAKANILKSNPFPRQIAMIGDGYSDLETKPFVDLFIGFGGNIVRPQVKQQSDYYITSKNLKSVLDILL